MTFWQKIFLGNTFQSYAIFLLIILGVVIVLKIFQKVILHRLKKITQKTENNIDDFAVSMVQSFGFWFLFYIGVYFGAKTLNLNPILSKALDALLIAWLVYRIAFWVERFFNYLLDKKKDVEEGEKSSFRLIGTILKIVVWVLGILLVLSNLGVNISSLIAGLGIGGIAAALAIQNILGDLFSSFAIYFDKPFVPGDFIVVGDYKGIVEKIGIKTTRIKSLQGEEIIISNKDLTSARVQNFKKMTDRRVSFDFGLEYNTPQDRLQKAKKAVAEIIKKTQKARLDRINFIEFGDSSLKFEAVYYIESPDFNVYREIHEKILLNIRKSFKELELSFAFPTQTIYLEK
ncbi:MAG TPA: mechanosensitive ion channel family protein [Patescibacteria group bacterium]|nr:mechanosensitive ion channel family protein [Patescibacteria group bacterium]